MSADIRAWMAEQDGARTVVDIAAGLPQYKAGKLARNVHRMWRDGLLTRSGRCRHYAFEIGRAPVERKLPREEALRRKAERERERSRQRIIAGQARSWDEWKAQCDARTAVTQASKAEAKAQRQRDREAERKERQERESARMAAREAARAARKRAPRPIRVRRAPKPRVVAERKPRSVVKPAAKPANVQPTIARQFVPFAPKPEPVAFESVEDFEKRGGVVIKLPPGASSQPLRNFGDWELEAA